MLALGECLRAWHWYKRTEVRENRKPLRFGDWLMIYRSKRQ